MWKLIKIAERRNIWDDLWASHSQNIFTHQFSVILHWRDSTHSEFHATLKGKNYFPKEPSSYFNLRLLELGSLFWFCVTHFCYLFFSSYIYLTISINPPVNLDGSAVSGIWSLPWRNKLASQFGEGRNIQICVLY